MILFYCVLIKYRVMLFTTTKRSTVLCCSEICTRTRLCASYHHTSCTRASRLLLAPACMASAAWNLLACCLAQASALTHAAVVHVGLYHDSSSVAGDGKCACTAVPTCVREFSLFICQQIRALCNGHKWKYGSCIPARRWSRRVAWPPKCIFVY